MLIVILIPQLVLKRSNALHWSMITSSTYIWLLFFGDDRSIFGLGIFVCVTFVTFWLLNLWSIYWTEQSSNSWRLELRCLAKLLNKQYARNPESQSKFAGEQYLLANTRNLWTSLYGFVYCIPTWPINPLSPNTLYDEFEFEFEFSKTVSTVSL